MVPSSDYGTGIFQRGPERWYSLYGCWIEISVGQKEIAALLQMHQWGKTKAHHELWETVTWLAQTTNCLLQKYRWQGGTCHSLALWHCLQIDFFCFDQAIPSQILRAMSLSRELEQLAWPRSCK